MPRPVFERPFCSIKSQYCITRSFTLNSLSMKNLVIGAFALLFTLLATEGFAQKSTKVWVEAGKSTFLIIPAAEKGKAGSETTTTTDTFTHKDGFTVKLIGKQNPDGKIVSIEVIPEKRMLVERNYSGVPESGYINDCCVMCCRLNPNGCFWCCIFCKIEHEY